MERKVFDPSDSPTQEIEIEKRNRTDSPHVRISVDGCSSSEEDSSEERGNIHPYQSKLEHLVSSYTLKVFSETSLPSGKHLEIPKKPLHTESTPDMHHSDSGLGTLIKKIAKDIGISMHMQDSPEHEKTPHDLKHHDHHDKPHKPHHDNHRGIRTSYSLSLNKSQDKHQEEHKEKTHH